MNDVIQKLRETGREITKGSSPETIKDAFSDLKNTLRDAGINEDPGKMLGRFGTDKTAVQTKTPSATASTAKDQYKGQQGDPTGGKATYKGKGVTEYTWDKPAGNQNPSPDSKDNTKPLLLKGHVEQNVQQNNTQTLLLKGHVEQNVFKDTDQKKILLKGHVEENVPKDTTQKKGDKPDPLKNLWDATKIGFNIRDGIEIARKTFKNVEKVTEGLVTTVEKIGKSPFGKKAIKVVPLLDTAANLDSAREHQEQAEKALEQMKEIEKASNYKITPAYLKAATAGMSHHLGAALNGLGIFVPTVGFIGDMAGWAGDLVNLPSGRKTPGK